MADVEIKDLTTAASLNDTDVIEIQQGTGIGSSKKATLAMLLAGNSYITNIGDGSAGSFLLTHNLNSRDVMVEVYRNATPWDTVLCDVSRTGVNTLTISGFGVAPSLNQFRVIIRKV